MERRPVAQIEPQRLEAFFRDDPLVAYRLAFDIVNTQRAPIDASSEVRVTRMTVAPASDDLAPLCIRLAVPLPCSMRLDRLLAQQLRLSRAAVHEIQERGDLCVAPDRDSALRATIRDGQCIRIRTPPIAG